MKTKKILSLVLAIVIAATSVVALAACKRNEEASIEGIVVTKNPTTVYEVGSPLTVGALEVSADWSDRARSTLRTGQYVTNADDIDVNTAGEKTLTIKLAEDEDIATELKLLYVAREAVVVSPSKVSVYVADDADKTELTAKKLEVGGTVQLAGEVIPEGATHKAFAWTSTNPQVVSVTSTGLVTGHMQGMADIVARSADGNRMTYVRILVEDDESPATYTSNGYVGTIATSWNPHTWELNTQQDMMLYVTAGFYTTQMNQTRDDYTWVPQMAGAMPQDVTANYVGEYGISDESKGRAWAIELNADAKWQDGTPVTADDYVFSMEKVLDPAMANYRADSHTFGSGEIVGASAYYNQGSVTLEHATEANGYNPATSDTYVSFEEIPLFTGAYSLNALVAYNPALGGLLTAFDTKYADNKVTESGKLEGSYKFAAAELEAMKVDLKAIAEQAAAPFGITDEAEYFADYSEWVFTAFTWPEVDFESVGFKKVDDNTLLFVYATELTEADVTLYCDAALVHPETYTEYTKDGVTTYNSDKDTTFSHGPYMIDKYSQGQSVSFVRNPHWIGWADETYSAENADTGVNLVVRTAETAEAEFKQGKLDSLTLTQPMLDTYKNSSRVLFTQDTSGFVNRILMNYDADSLASIDAGEGFYKGEDQEKNTRTLLSPDFREALYYSIDRAALTNAATAGELPAYYLLGSVFYFDMKDATGTLYREQESAKKVVVDYFGVRYVGDGKGDLDGANEYADLDAALAATATMGYDVAKAKALFTSAHEELTKEGGVFAGGITDHNGDVVLAIGVGGDFIDAPDLIAPYQQVIQAGVTEATKGTPFEGKVTIKCILQAGGSAVSRYALVSGEHDGGDISMAIGANGGALMRPEYLLSVICGEHGAYGQGFDPSQHNFDYDLNGDGTIDEETERRSIEDWYLDLNTASDGVGGAYAAWKPGTPDSTPDQNLQFMEMTAALELAILRANMTIPLSAIASRSLLSFRYETGIVDQHPQFGRAGTWSKFTDAEWAEFIADNKDSAGNLNYKD